MVPLTKEIGMFFPPLIPQYAILLKAFTVLALVVPLTLAYQLFTSGRLLAASARIQGGHRPEIVSHHRRLVTSLAAALFVAVCFIEANVRLTLHPYASSYWLFRIHLAMDAALVIIGAAVWLRYNGQDYPRAHRTLVYLLLALFAGIVTTGSVLLNNL